MKRILLSFILALGLQGAAAPHSSAAVLDCLSVSSPTINTTGGTVVATFQVSQICGLPGFSTASPIFTISQDPTGSPCAGSAFMTGQTKYLGQIVCTLGSSRIGSSSSQLQIWLPGESSKFINFSYPTIARVTLSSCIQLGGGTSSASSSQITLRATVTSTCTVSQLGNANFSTPVYEIVEESDLLSLAKCNGPSVGPTGTLGTVVCTFPINQNFFGSQRTGATSSTIKIWFAWDFSETRLAVSHIAIPYSCPTISCSSGSSSGASSGTVVPQATPVKPSCTAAPEVPVLTITHPDDNLGPLFHFKIASTGQPAVSMSYSYSLYDKNTETWGTWTPWTLINSTMGLLGSDFQSQLQDGISRIAFAVYASNTCGSSTQARESIAKTGVLLIAEKTYKDLLAKDQLTVINLLTTLDKSILDFPASAADLAQVKTQAPTFPIFVGDPDLDVTPLVNYVNAVTTWVTLGAKTIDKAAADKAAADKAAADKAAADALAARKAADAAAKAQADKNAAAALAAQKAAAAKAALQKKTTITCIKGKLTKTVTAVKPVCPLGYKKK